MSALYISAIPSVDQTTCNITDIPSYNYVKLIQLHIASVMSTTNIKNIAADTGIILYIGIMMSYFLL